MESLRLANVIDTAHVRVGDLTGYANLIGESFQRGWIGRPRIG